MSLFNHFIYGEPHCVTFPQLRSVLTLLAEPTSPEQVAVDTMIGNEWSRRSPDLYRSQGGGKGLPSKDTIIRHRWAMELAYDVFLRDKDVETLAAYIHKAVKTPAHDHLYKPLCSPSVVKRHGFTMLAAGFFAVYAHEYFLCADEHADREENGDSRVRYFSEQPDKYLDDIDRDVRALVKRLYDAGPQAVMARNPYECDTLYDRVRQASSHFACSSVRSKVHYCIYMPITEDGRTLYDILVARYIRSQFREEALRVASEAVEYLIYERASGVRPKG